MFQYFPPQPGCEGFFTAFFVARFFFPRTFFYFFCLSLFFLFPEGRTEVKSFRGLFFETSPLSFTFSGFVIAPHPT